MGNANIDKYLIIIPAYNEEKKIASVIQGVQKSFPDADILVINDGSTDRTEEEVLKNGAKVILHPFNLGYGAALQTGYKFALGHGYEAVIQMDGDGQHDPSFLPKLLEVIRKGEADIVIGSRFLPMKSTPLDTPNYPAPFIRRVGMKVFGTITSLIVRQKITDSTSGYQAMNQRVLEWVSSDQFPWDYPDADVIIMLHRAGFRIKEVAVRMFPSENKKSMHSGWKPIYYIFKMFLSILVTLMRK